VKARKAPAQRRDRRPARQDPADDIDLARALSAAGFAEREIAAVVGCTPEEFAERFGPAMADAETIANGKMLAAVYRQGLAGNMTAARLWLSFASIMPASKAPQPRPAALGKKELARQAANNPNDSNPMGELMLRRRAMGKKQVAEFMAQQPAADDDWAELLADPTDKPN